MRKRLKGRYDAEVKPELLRILLDLKEDEFTDFKWYLEYEIVKGFPGIPVARLENADRKKTVDLMIQQYLDNGALKVTMKALEHIVRNDLVQCVPDFCSGQKGKKTLEDADAAYHEKSTSSAQKEVDPPSNPTMQGVGGPKKRSSGKKTLEDTDAVFHEKSERNNLVLVLFVLFCFVSLSVGVYCLVFSSAQKEVDLPRKVNPPRKVDPPRNPTTQGVGGPKENSERELELREVQQFAEDVTLDPDTAHLKLIVTDDGKQVYCGDKVQNLRNYPKRFYRGRYVIGKQSISKGKCYYEVEVKGKTGWILGVVKESIERKRSIIIGPKTGFWTMWLKNGDLFEGNNNPAEHLSVQPDPQKVGVFVDYDKGLVNFYDVDTEALLYSFTGFSFTEKLYPFFCPCNSENGDNSAPLTISPVKQNNGIFNFLSSLSK